jgi:hypothetical protein
MVNDFNQTKTPVGPSLNDINEKLRISQLHMKTLIIGEETDESCPCCGNKLIRPYDVSTFNSIDFFRYGLDVHLFVKASKYLIIRLGLIWVPFIILAVVVWLTDPEAIQVDNYLLILDYLLIAMAVSNRWYYFICVCLVTGATLYILTDLQRFVKAETVRFKEYMNNKNLDESLFTVVVKGLPSETKESELALYMNGKFGVTVMKVHLLNDAKEIEDLMKGLKKFKKEDATNVPEIYRLSEEIRHNFENPKHTGVALVVLNRSVDKLKFIKNLGLFTFTSKSDYFQNQQIHFETISTIKYVSWRNLKLDFSGLCTWPTWKMVLCSYLGNVILLGTLYGLINMITIYKFFDNNKTNSIISNAILIPLNILAKYVLRFIVYMYCFTDKYYYEYLTTYVINQNYMRKKIYLFILASFTIGLEDGDSDARERLFYIILTYMLSANIQGIVTNLFNYVSFIKNKVLYYFSKKEKLTQDEVNKFTSWSIFDMISTFETFKSLYVLTLLLMLYSPTLCLISMVLLVGFYFSMMIGCMRSGIKDINIYGTYFHRVTFVDTLLTVGYCCCLNFMNVSAIAALYFPFWQLVEFYFSFFYFKRIYNDYDIINEYQNTKVTEKFEDCKYVNLNLLREEFSNTK